MSEGNVEQIIAVISLSAFILLGILFGVVSTVLNYHWMRYGIEQGQVKKVKSLYFGIAGILFLIMVAALFFVL